MINRTGITNTPKMVPINIPPTAPVPIDLFPAAPAPVDTINGMIPKMNAKEVIKIGLKRASAPSIAACTIDSPDRLLDTANYTIRMAFLANKPISMIRVICR